MNTLENLKLFKSKRLFNLFDNISDIFMLGGKPVCLSDAVRLTFPDYSFIDFNGDFFCSDGTDPALAKFVSGLNTQLEKSRDKLLDTSRILCDFIINDQGERRALLFDALSLESASDHSPEQVTVLLMKLYQAAKNVHLDRKTATKGRRQLFYRVCRLFI